jgi:hypothetical protein
LLGGRDLLLCAKHLVGAARTPLTLQVAADEVIE